MQKTFGICLLLVFLFLIYSFFSFLGPKPNRKLEKIGYSTLSRQQYKLITNFAKITNVTTNEWIQSLQYAKIMKRVTIDMSGLADKHVFILEGGYVCMAKPVLRNLIFFSHDIFKIELSHPSNEIRRIDRDYQGWGEIAAFAVDLALDFRRKPPIIGRYVRIDELYETPFSNFFSGSLVPVSMHAWVEGLQSQIPSQNMGEFLTHQRASLTPITSESRALEYSDVLIFDFLVDEHDRFGHHNWKGVKDGRILVWDSGLAWNFGPYHYNLDILCGPHHWVGLDPGSRFDISRAGCNRICAFRNETIGKLIYHNKNNSLGKKVKEILEKDLIYPIFSNGLYTTRNYGSLYFEVVRFADESFYNGLDYRLAILLHHVNNCIDKYGANVVLR